VKAGLFSKSFPESAGFQKFSKLNHPVFVENFLETFHFSPIFLYHHDGLDEIADKNSKVSHIFVQLDLTSGIFPGKISSV
jgi:hypothetical protein